ncbi:porin [Erwinia sp. S38]|uniref:porin n=1 Tax=Erwinia sp. S38 TaxID=2769338 RepID=UPI00190DF21E|nr:autotransporter domain-containing protein [Erwinia sp. S38]MBJ9999595.1 porin [Erwinia sp. S38]
MIASKKRYAIHAILLIFTCWSTELYAEITLLQQNRDNPDWLSRLDFSVNGSIRPQFNDVMGSSDKGSYKRNGFDDGDNQTRFGFAADYYLRDGVSWYTYYEFGLNMPALFDWKNHYEEGSAFTTRRMLFTGLKADDMGELTIGQQTSVYYDVVAAKTDLWDDDMLAQAPGVGINGAYDGSYRPRKQLKFRNSYGSVDLYAGWLFPDSEYLVGDGTRYRRKGGGSLGLDYHIDDDLSLGMAWNETRATIKHPGTGDDKTYNQHIVGAALSWVPDNWTFAAGGGWYKNFLQTESSRTDNYFVGSAWGIEYYAGYSFHLDRAGLKTVQPFFMGDRLEYVSGRNYKRIDNGLGLLLAFAWGFSVDYEHMFTSSTDRQGDVNFVRLSYDF